MPVHSLRPTPTEHRVLDCEIARRDAVAAFKTALAHVLAACAAEQEALADLRREREQSRRAS